MAKKIKTNRKHRICRISGCKNVLSIYNMEHYCYAHQQLAITRESFPVVSVKH